MIDFRTLGTVQLRTARGREIRSVLTQPKRLALLGYLSAARPRGFHRRDSLLGLFWPELDQRHARAALRKALHHLRRSLGAEAVVNRGAQEVGVRHDLLRCDAVQLAAAFEAGDYTTALELYRGELLDGLFVSDAPGFERWLNEERSWLRRGAVQAAWSVAEELEADGAVAAAAHAARRGASLAFPDESATGRLIRLLARSGNRAGALQTFAEFKARLRSEYEVEPSGELRQLVEGLRSRAVGAADDEPETERIGRPPPRIEPSRNTLEAGPEPGPGEATGGAPPASGDEPRLPVPGDAPGVPQTGDAPHRRRVLPGVLTVIVGAAALAWVAGQRFRTVPPEATERVVVLPFSAHTGAEFAYFGAGLAELLDTNIDGVGEYRTVDSHALSRVVASLGGAEVDPERGSEVAERVGADWYILGSVVEAGGRLRGRAALYPAGDVRPVEMAVAERSADELFTLVDELTIGLFGGRGVPVDERLSRLAELTTRSPMALRAYLEGEALFRNADFYPVETRFRHAIEAFRRAVAADSTFALAWYRLGAAAGWAYDYETQHQAFERAARLADRLPERYRLLLRGVQLGAAGDADEAERLLRSVLDAYPEDVDAWWNLGEVLLHSAALRGRRIRESRPAFDRVLEINPGHREALLHLYQIAMMEGDRRLADSVTTVLYGDEPPLPRKAAEALTWGDGAARGRVLSELGDAPLLQLQQTLWVLLGDYRNPGAAERVDQMMAEREELTGEWRGIAAAQRGYLRLATGRVRSAMAAFEAAADAFPVAAMQAMGTLALLPYVELPAHQLRDLRNRLTVADTAAPPVAMNMFIQDSAPVNGVIREYQLGLLSARLGDDEAALHSADRLDGLARPVPVRMLARDLAREVRAQVDVFDNRPVRALRRLESMELQSPLGAWPPVIFLRSNGRFLRAMVLEGMGRREEALRWYASLAQGYDSAQEFIYAGPAHFARGRILDELGRPREAMDQYAAFLTLWDAPDPEFRPMVMEARTRLERLAGN